VEHSFDKSWSCHESIWCEAVSQRDKLLGFYLRLAGLGASLTPALCLCAQLP